MEERKIWDAERGRGGCDVSSLCSHSKKERPADGRKGGLDWRFMREDYGWRMRLGSVERWEVGGRGVKKFDRHEGDETGEARGAGVRGKATGVNGR